MTDYDLPILNALPDPRTEAEFYSGVAVKRGLAWIADVTLVAILSAVIVPFTAFTALFFFPLLMLLVGFAYRWATIAGGSATWGMRLMSIELREADGGRLAPATAFMHTLGYTAAVAIFPLQLVSAAMMLGTDRGQGLGDVVLGTTAINRPAR